MDTSKYLNLALGGLHAYNRFICYLKTHRHAINTTCTLPDNFSIAPPTLALNECAVYLTIFDTLMRGKTWCDQLTTSFESLRYVANTLMRWCNVLRGTCEMSSLYYDGNESNSIVIMHNIILEVIHFINFLFLVRIHWCNKQIS